MRLKAIKLAGFKSFVDPTTINLVSNLTAVVGPNGCGKSNVIDAVRWVMGESSAKHLRGGSLTDVIFAGSANRKPVGQATVELLFDNVQGKLGGEYASYSEIAIKRQVTREGHSQYYLNGQRCRRKDITDIFLGTGLGPRSYAIIEQGMITRVIEAKPEDLRSFIEEAAGISKYKERRRETENRIQHTQENLARLNDLREELNKQLKHLDRQSQTAAKYQELKTIEKKISAELASLAWQRLDKEVLECEAHIRETQVQLASAQSSAQQLKTAQEKHRILQTEASDNLNEVQKRYYGLGADIAKIEQALMHHEERKEQLKLDKQDAKQSLDTAQSLLEIDKENFAEYQNKIENATPLHEQACQDAQTAQALSDEKEAAVENWREAVSALNQSLMAPSRLAESEKTKIAQLERQSQQIHERVRRLDGESQSLTIEDPAELNSLKEKGEALSAKRQECIQWLESVASEKENHRQELNKFQADYKVSMQSLHEAKGKLSALETLQAGAVGKNFDAKKAWLAQHGVDNPTIIASMIQVSAGWEKALETVLEGYLQAIGVQSLETGKIGSAPDASKMGLHLLEWTKHAGLNAPSQSLVNFVTNKNDLPAVLFNLLANVIAVENMDEAQKRLPDLRDQSIITKDGAWLGQGWLKLNAPDDSKNGILIREEKIKQLRQEIIVLEEKLQQIKETIESVESKIKSFEAEKESKQQEKNTLSQEISSIDSERRIKQNRIEQNQKRKDQIQKELAECQSILQDSQNEINQSRGLLHQALEEMAENNRKQAELTSQKAQYQDALAIARSKAKEANNRVNELVLMLQSYRTQKAALESNINRLTTQIETAKQKLTNLELAWEKADEPMMILKKDLESNLEKRLVVENELNSARDVVAKLDNDSREMEKELNQLEQKIEQLREKNEQVKMQWQALSVHRENVLEKLKDLNVSLEETLKAMPVEATEKEWQNELAQLEQKIRQLGPINLAAIEEFDAAKQRHEYLEAQLKDLTEALETLESAIKKIDKETRAKFQETFEQINKGFQELFPKLFGGGQASLMMTGEDLLDTGISLTARPPGKKNSSISQLSGGEKALTAVALVFAIFGLNPAPFCMLDEVDAPLDDNNVGRFCKLVKEMSSTVQFIFVSHSKITIEMGEQLQGVTMREPGVSRLVTVDIEEAKTLAEA